MKEFSNDQTFNKWIMFVGKQGFTSVKSGYSCYSITKSTVNVVKFTRALADIIKVNCDIMKGMAY